MLFQSPRLVVSQEGLAWLQAADQSPVSCHHPRGDPGKHRPQPLDGGPQPVLTREPVGLSPAPTQQRTTARPTWCGHSLLKTPSGSHCPQDKVQAARKPRQALPPSQPPLSHLCPASTQPFPQATPRRHGGRPAPVDHHISPAARIPLKAPLQCRPPPAPHQALPGLLCTLLASMWPVP